MPENKKNLRVVFMGTPEFSATILTALIDDGYGIVGVFTQSDKKVGRKQILEKSPVRIVAEKNGIPVFTPAKLHAEAVEELRSLKPDLIILVAYGKILPQAVLDLPRLGAINIHPSLLPKFRGPSPIQNALLAGEKITGTTIMLMDAGIDTGDILRQKEIAINPDETYVELAEKLSGFSAELLLETLDGFLAGKIVPQKQDGTSASYCKLIKKTDGQIDWEDTAKNIYNKYRAFAAWPGIFTSWNADGQAKRIQLKKITLIGDDPADRRQPGEIFRQDNSIHVRTADGAIGLAEIQLEGKPAVKAVDFINGYKNFIGSKLN
ncbi:MAG: methionyl-tRNA formyltransferase [Candidatus Moranbacteria bacterium]|nr:methionyl-tRNA formyltransferase [Candidatus Moranbacteria bacterium]